MDTPDDEIPLSTLLRTALVDLVTESGGRRNLEPLLHLGVPGGRHQVFEDDPGYDSGLRADVLEHVLDMIDLDPVPVPWLTRSGVLAPGDLDYAWLGAVSEAFGRHGLVLPGFFVMTRHGWFDLLDDGEPVRCKVRARRRRRRASVSPRVHRLVAVHPLPVIEQDMTQGF